MASLTESAALERLSRLLDYLAQDPNNPHLLADVADAQLQLGQWAEAKACLQRLLDGQPQDAQARYRLAVAERASGHADVATRLLQALVEEGHSHPAVLQELARSQAQQGEWAATARTLGPLQPATLPPDEGDAVWLLRIRAAHHLGDLEAAQAEAQQWMDARGPALPLRGRAAIATLMLDTERLDDAGKLLEVVDAQTLAGNAELSTVAGYVELSHGRAEAAQAFFAQGASLHPELGRAHLGQGLAAAYRGDTAGALAALQQATRVSPDHLGSWHALAWMQLLSRDLEGAEASFASALAQDDNFGETHGGLALVAALRGDREAAEKHLRTGAKLDPASTNVMVAKVVLQRGPGQLDPEVLGPALNRFMGLAATRNPALQALLTRMTTAK